MACLLLWVARFPSCLVLALACARAWSVVPLGASALFLVLRLVGDDPRTDPFLTFQRDALLIRYLSTPVYVCVCIRVSSSTT